MTPTSVIVGAAVLVILLQEAVWHFAFPRSDRGRAAAAALSGAGYTAAWIMALVMGDHDLANFTIILAGYWTGVSIATWIRRNRRKLSAKLAGYKHRARLAAMKVRLPRTVHA